MSLSEFLKATEGGLKMPKTNISPEKCIYAVICLILYICGEFKTDL